MFPSQTAPAVKDKPAVAARVTRAADARAVHQHVDEGDRSRGEAWRAVMQDQIQPVLLHLGQANMNLSLTVSHPERVVYNNKRAYAPVQTRTHPNTKKPHEHVCADTVKHTHGSVSSTSVFTCSARSSVSILSSAMERERVGGGVLSAAGALLWVHCPWFK